MLNTRCLLPHCRVHSHHVETSSFYITMYAEHLICFEAISDVINQACPASSNLIFSKHTEN